MLDILLPLALSVAILFGLRRAGGRQGGWKRERALLAYSTSTRGFIHIPGRITLLFGPGGRRFMEGVYDLGAVVGILGGIVALIGLLVGTGKVWSAVAAQLGGQVVWAGFSPIIPGLAAPLSDFPTLFLAVLVSELIHEQGHALCAALDDTSATKFTISVGILPSASFTFTSIDDLPRRSRVRIWSAGAFHNILLWLFLFAITSPLQQGREILTIPPHSGLDRHLQVHDGITHVNDFPVGNKEWEYVVADHDREDPRQGWCILKNKFTAAPLSVGNRCPDPQLSIFNETPTHTEPHCLPPHEIVNSPIRLCACAPSEVCVRPAAGERIMRLRYIRGKHTRIFVWKGQRLLLHSLGVSAPRGEFAMWRANFVLYLRMVSIWCFIIKLLPLESLDGGRILAALLPGKSLKDDEENGLGLGEESWDHKLKGGVSQVVAAVVVAWAAGWTALGVLPWR